MSQTTSRILVAVALPLVLTASPAFAGQDRGDQTANDEQPPSIDEADESAAADDPHYRGDILVSADALGELDFIAGQDVLGLEEIQRNLNGQLGEMLTKIPGVSASSFSPGASRPILRGLEGERVRVLIDGLGAADIGNTSADHATTIDPLTVERIEVLRGPAALLFGSQAIGGVVNVIDRRIPTAFPVGGVHVDALSAFATADDLRSGGASIDAGVTDILVLHLDGSYRETGDLEIPGFQLTDKLRSGLLAQAAELDADGDAEEADELREAANQSGFVPNSGTETWTVNGGFGVILGDTTFGASVGYFDTNYGLVSYPAGGAPHGDEGEDGGEAPVSIALQQVRADLRADITLGGGFFSRIKLRGGYSDYTHTEFEGTAIGTVFDSETFEARAELTQFGGGAIGAQFTSRDFRAAGEEAFVAPNKTASFAAFTAQEFELGGVQIEAAGRYEIVDVQSKPLAIGRQFNLLSGALSAVVESEGGTRFGVTASRSERAPVGEELFANGPHIATQIFEVGEPDLLTEKAWGLETFVRAEAGDIAFNASFYYQAFGDFIFLSPTGGEEDDLPVFTFVQDDADFFGFEAALAIPVIEDDDFTLSTDLRASYVSAKLDNGSNVPRIPPISLLAALSADVSAFNVRGEVQWFGEQDDIAEFETATDDFTFVNLYLSWRPIRDNKDVVLQLAGENLFDAVGRRHTGFTKEFLPLPGRNIRASVRIGF